MKIYYKLIIFKKYNITTKTSHKFSIKENAKIGLIISSKTSIST